MKIVNPGTIENTIIKFGKVITLPENTVIFNKGDQGDNFYYIIDGSVTFSFHNLKAKECFTKGHFFGELSYLIDDHRRSATATTMTEATLVEITPQIAERLIQNHGNIILRILKNVCTYFIKSEQSLILDLKNKNKELKKNLNYLRNFKEELDEKELKLQTDDLTGLYNRRCLNLQFEKYIDGINSKYEPLGIMMIDLDDFKSINDTHGHNTGDNILKKTASIVKQSIRDNDIPCRLGGDEFIILLPDISSENGLALAEKIQNRICCIDTGIKNLNVSVSIGGTMHILGETSYDLLDRVDHAMYKVKKSGKNGYNWEN